MLPVYICRASVSTTPEQAITHLQSANLLQQEISKQVARIGSTSLTDFENAADEESFLKLWYCKNDLRTKYIELCETKHPMAQSRQDGHHSNLGKYSWDHSPFEDTFLSYEELFTLEADHPFWNDGLFTNSGEPWAVDPNTCHSM
ncbi:hypothetical protein CROQUDRAFT_99043 [Cronartium quercuum f. sp. fusiforme G11]|uniref:Uncharacterized protein n=1 Tax=Cronartium quercuum f. sp. fusiforme G11 TaxID=708437 RepID=A0A9P6N8Z7_9BASI|nr:hypothetical protein CROQUDRAFT_99043 [Cronartium quercuum f. sp. fusiforme G11]